MQRDFVFIWLTFQKENVHKQLQNPPKGSILKLERSLVAASDPWVYKQQAAFQNHRSSGS